MGSRLVLLLRVPALFVVTAQALTARSSSDSVPQGQELQPVSAPSDWTMNTLDGIKISTPATWSKSTTKQANPTKVLGTVELPTSSK